MKRYVTLPRNLGSIIQENYRCSGCWNRVIFGHDKNGDFLDCGTEDCNKTGLVHYKFVERMVQRHESLAAEYRIVLFPLFDWLKPKELPKSIETNLRQLGF